ncbi:endo-beta-N-acetylglucosaminidase H [Microbacterium aurantiacum]|uniref:endo-beta-N-acetylglucosaminidase H n=1 Tax=Microbacterium aurantiacum TaxID=162393 RepID=UPI001CA48D21|nr:endo-beta-N-acetylglucosaminidase H [Microbacterium aurantiacum]
MKQSHPYPSVSHPRRMRAALAAAALGIAAVGMSLTATAATASVEPTPPVDDPKRVVYVEVNSNDMSNVADYTLEGTLRPAFDIAVIFAANINYDTEKGAAYLHLNERVTETLENADSQIRPLQQRGTKVLLSVLGNHQGAGIANFTSREDAAAFADELAAVVDQYGLDGIDFDDEWSKYGENGTAQPNESSFVHLVDELRQRLGDDKLITLYNIGPAAEATEFDGIRAGDLLDYAWNPWYGSWDVPQIPGMDAGQLAAGAVDLTRTPQATAAAFAERTVEEGFGALVTYNLTAGDHSGYISSLTEPLTGHATAHRAPWYDVDVEAAATCAGGDVKLKVLVDSADPETLSAEVISSIGTRSSTGIVAGEPRAIVQHAKHGAVADGSLTVRIMGAEGGTAELALPYQVPACR